MKEYHHKKNKKHCKFCNYLPWWWW